MGERMTAAAYNAKGKPKRSKPIDREGTVQIEIVNWLRDVLPSECIVHHCKNEINSSGHSVAREIAQAKVRGLVPGFPDLVILPYATAGVFFLKVKAPKGTVQTVQTDIHTKMAALGYHVAVVRSVDDVRDCLIKWSIGFVEILPCRGQIS